MGLPRAIRAHGSNDLVEAEIHYKRALEQNVTVPVLFQNYGSLLASTGKPELAGKIYRKGLSLHPNNHQIIRNYANLLRSKAPSNAVALYLRFLKLIARDEKIFSKVVYQQVVCDICDVLMSLELNAWALEVLREGIFSTGLSPGFLKNLLLLSEGPINSSLLSSKFVISEQLFDQLSRENCDPVQQLVFHFSLAFYRFKKYDYASSLKSYQQGVDTFHDSIKKLSADEITKARKLLNDNCWNLSCLKLNLADFDGWRFYDYGLLASAPGKQRWQRALTKPFSDQEIPIWRGESLQGKNLLLMEEQAIGDAMMFMTCLPDLLPRLNHITIFLSHRLAPIYKRTFKDLIVQGKIHVCTKQDVIDGSLIASNFHYQSALGSIIQYLYNSFQDLAESSLQIYPSARLSNSLRSKYLGAENSQLNKPFLVGISWRGGGNPSRSKEKSFDLDQFSSILSSVPNIKYVSLQYGDSSSQCELWSNRGIDLVYDSSINPLKDMDSWLSQVDACDAVLSVANTTIHGAGGLNKPTLCLLSQFCDWRWFYDSRIQRSYWYPSVGIARQSNDGDWSQAISHAIKWLKSGCPYPSGSQWL